jgi:putative zinc finger/helix-turn-helix YgiT family protein
MKLSKECQVCGSNNVREIIRTEIFEYNGEKIPIENYAVVHCDTCGEEVAGPESRNRSIPILRDAQRLIDRFLTAKEIRSIRKSFNMTQAQFSELLGGGEKGFARYETGRVLQSRPMDNLLRILSRHPETIETLQNHTGEAASECTMIMNERKNEIAMPQLTPPA